jgi:hypothetical protein
MTAALDEVQRRLAGGLRGVATSEARIGAVRTAQESPTLLGVAGVVAAGAVAYGAYALVSRGRRRRGPQVGVGENFKRGVELVREELAEGAERLEEVARGVLPRGVLLKLEPEDGGYVRVSDARLEPPPNKKRGRSTVIKKLVWAALLSIFMAVGSVLARRVADAVWRAMVHEEPPTTRSKVAS